MFYGLLITCFSLSCKNFTVENYWDGSKNSMSVSKKAILTPYFPHFYTPTTALPPVQTKFEKISLKKLKCKNIRVAQIPFNH